MATATTTAHEQLPPDKVLLSFLPPFRTPSLDPSGLLQGRRRRRGFATGRTMACCPRGHPDVPRVKATGQCSHLGRPVRRSGPQVHAAFFFVFGALGYREGQEGGEGLSVPAGTGGGDGCYNAYIKRRSPGGEDGLREAGLGWMMGRHGMYHCVLHGSTHDVAGSKPGASCEGQVELGSSKQQQPLRSTHSDSDTGSTVCMYVRTERMHDSGRGGGNHGRQLGGRSPQALGSYRAASAL